MIKLIFKLVEDADGVYLTHKRSIEFPERLNENDVVVEQLDNETFSVAVDSLECCDSNPEFMSKITEQIETIFNNHERWELIDYKR